MCILCDAQAKRTERVEALREKITTEIIPDVALMIGDGDDREDLMQTITLMANGTGLTRTEVEGLWLRSETVTLAGLASAIQGVPVSTIMEGLAFESMLFGMVLRDLVLEREQEGAADA